MIAGSQRLNDQDILAYFTRPTRTINHRLISQIRSGDRHANVKEASPEALSDFLAAWPQVDPETGLNIHGDELLIKAREAMIGAVHTFNGAGITFRAELFIVSAIIAWTYLLHAWFRRAGIDYRYYRKGEVVLTKHGAEKFWELEKCLNDHRCPVPNGPKNNLKILINLRHEIEHRSTNRIDDAVLGRLQACCLNFNDLLQSEFGPQFGLERRLSIALQFVSFSADQRSILTKAKSLPQNVETLIENFEQNLSDEEISDPKYSYKLAMVPISAKRENSANEAIEFISPGSDEAVEIQKILLNEIEKAKYLPKEIVTKMQEEGFDNFSMHDHTLLWKRLGAKDPNRGYGIESLGGRWGWYENWLQRVREECEQHPEQYQSLQ
jgi:hypothetical protein